MEHLNETMAALVSAGYWGKLTVVETSKSRRGYSGASTQLKQTGNQQLQCFLTKRIRVVLFKDNGQRAENGLVDSWW